jgi:hypothetical protein
VTVERGYLTDGVTPSLTVGASMESDGGVAPSLTVEALFVSLLLAKPVARGLLRSFECNRAPTVREGAPCAPGMVHCCFW